MDAQLRNINLNLMVLLKALLHVSGYAAAPPMLSRVAIASSGSSSVAALRFSRRCWTDDVPGMSSMFEDRCKSHASAICIGVASSVLATSLSFDDCRGENPPSGK